MEVKSNGLFGARAILLRLLLLVFLAAGLSVETWAQNTASIKGTVTDASGAAIAGAKVTVKNTNQGIERVTQTNADGYYEVPALPPGTYSVDVQQQGFEHAVANDVPLQVSRNSVQDFRLKIASTDTVVTVESTLPVVESTSISVGQVIDNKTVQDIPLNGRHFVDLALLIPGTVTPPQNGFLTAPLRGQGSFAFNSAGQREDTTNFMVNGINLSDEVQNQITFQPSVNTVQEFKVNNSTFSAEYGRNSGSIVNIATRNGTNDLHGEVFEYYRNNAMDARNFFNTSPNPQAQFNRNNFGAAAGGPIKKDRAFFFASYEGLRQRQGITVNTLVPTDAERATVTNANIAKLVALIPHVNSGTNRFTGSISAPVNIDQGTGDLQFNLTQNDTLHGYLAIQQDLRQEPTLQGNNLPGWGDTRQARRQIMTVNETHVFGPRLTNEARLGYNRIHISFAPNALLDPSSFGIANGLSGPVGLPQISVNNALNIGGPAGFPQARGDTTAVFSDTLHYLRGRHSLAIGGEVRRFYNNNVSENIGSFGFASITNFLNDQANAFTVLQGSGDDKILEPAWGIFLQDNFKLRPNLTLELGLRYDYNSTPSEANNKFVGFDPATSSLEQVGTGGFGQVYNTNNKNIQPRVGFAWDPFGDTKTVVRAAYGLLTDQPVTNSVSGMSGNPPFALPISSSSSTNSLSLEAPGGSGPAAVSPSTISRTFNNAYAQSWNLNVQREITPTMGLMVGYFATKGTHLRIARNLNQPISGARPFTTLGGTILTGTGVGNVTEADSSGNSIYNALWVTFDKRTSHGLQFNTSYTFSKSIDYNSLSSQGVVVQDSYNLVNDRGLSDFDARHRFVINLIYDLPFKGNRLVEGWELSTISQAQTGNPITILTANTGFTGNRTVRPDVTGPAVTTGNPSQWFADPTVFTAGATAHFGNLGRNTVTGPNFVNTDFSVIKNTKVTERVNTQLRIEMFDVFNHPNFGNPGRILGNGFGVITSTRFPTGDFGSSRQLQLALKLQF
jgi:Carboxypeptidase regulatory-like domain/TonB dependent receptor-like, beta-barrel